MIAAGAVASGSVLAHRSMPDSMLMSVYPQAFTFHAIWSSRHREHEWILSDIGLQSRDEGFWLPPPKDIAFCPTTG